MFTKTLATAIVSGLLLTGAMSGSSIARDGGGADWARLTNPDGSTVTARGGRHGTRTVTTRDASGNVTKKEVVGKKAAKKAPRRNTRPWASAYDPETRTRTTAIGNGDGTRTVITISPFGIGIGLSR